MFQRRQAAYRNFLAPLLILCLLLPSLTLAASRTANRSQLQHRKANLQTKIHLVRLHIRYVKQKAQQTSSQLHAVEHRLIIARGQLQYATARFERAKVELHRATVALRDARIQFTDAQQQTRQRLVTMYERSGKGYMALLVSANDYGEMLQRAQLARFIMQQDRHVLDDLKQRKAKVENYQVQVKQKTAEVATWKWQAALVHERTNNQRVVVAKQLTSVRDEQAGLEAELDALERDSAAVESMLRRMETTVAGRRRYHTVYAGGLGGMLPVDGRITSPFGWRIHPITHMRRLHTGVDIAAPYGTPIHATGGGEVIYAGWRGGYGNAVIIDHGGGRATLYGHMSSIAVATGQVVAKEQVIGHVGSTGVSTGPHVHYELRINGVPVAPPL